MPASRSPGELKGSHGARRLAAARLRTLGCAATACGARAPADRLCARLMDAATLFSRGVLRDDVAILVIEPTGLKPPAGQAGQMSVL